MKNTWKNHALLAASLAVVLVAIGCGRQETQSKAAVKEGKGMRLASSQTGGPRDEVASNAALAAETPPVETAGTGSENPVAGTATSAVSEPPDVNAAIADSIIVPGGVVTVTAHTSSDAVAVTLSDGIGKPKPFTYDAGAGQWTTTYRVPLRAASERIGLSITAKNAQNQWSRVWVFTRSHAVEVASDITGECAGDSSESGE